MGPRTRRPESARPVRIGTAFYDRGRCLPWAMATECIVCEEWCPTSPKAIYLRPAEVVDANGTVKQVQQPYLDPQLVRGMWGLRVCVSGTGSASRVCHQHRRKPIPDQSNPAEPGQEEAKLSQGFRLFLASILLVGLMLAAGAGCHRKAAVKSGFISGLRRSVGMDQDR